MSPRPLRIAVYVLVLPLVVYGLLRVTDDVWYPRFVLGAAAFLWVVGLVRGRARRDGLAVARCIGLVVFAGIVAWQETRLPDHVCLQTPPGPRAAHTRAIQVAALRHLALEHARRGPHYHYSVSVEREDPPPAVLAQLTDLPVRLRPASASAFAAPGAIPGAGTDGSIYDPETNELGRILRIGAPVWISDCAVEIAVSYYQGRLNAAGCDYRMRWTGDGWEMVGYGERFWVS